MYIVNWLYNTLSLWARRYKQYMSPMLMTLATLGITLAIWLEAEHPERSDLVTTAAIVGVLALILAYISVSREKAEEKKRHQELIAELKGFREDIKAGVITKVKDDANIR